MFHLLNVEPHAPGRVHQGSACITPWGRDGHSHQCDRKNVPVDKLWTVCFHHSAGSAVEKVWIMRTTQAEILFLETHFET